MNKLGIEKNKLDKIEKQIINLKLNMLDETFTFNSTDFDLRYLVKLHSYLFDEFYFNCDRGLRRLSNIEKKLINELLKEISYVCINNPCDINLIINNIVEIWALQPFVNGNTRTLVAFLKVITECFDLNLDMDVNRNIVSNPKTFEKYMLVNQKRLTR